LLLSSPPQSFGHLSLTSPGALLVFYIHIQVPLIVDAYKLPIMNRAKVFRPLRIAVNGNDFAVVESVVTALQLPHHLALVGYGSPFNDRRFDDLRGVSTEASSGEFVSLVTGLDSTQPGSLGLLFRREAQNEFLAPFYTFVSVPRVANGDSYHGWL
jgi:hypothetical protein